MLRYFVELVRLAEMATAPPGEEELREVARNRGLRLVKSRKRTPGSGDYGKFGLTDPQGKQLFGFGADGLTADAEDIERYLRSGIADTWRTSAKTTEAKKNSAPPTTDVKPAAKRAPQQEARSGSAVKPKTAPSETKIPEKSKAPPPLRIRAAKANDAAAIAKLLAGLNRVNGGDKELKRRIAPFKGSQNGMIVADQGGVIGVAAWSTILTLQQGLIGRITVLLVQEASRRRGVGRKLLETVEAALAKTGCNAIEAMSDIEIRNAHGFFRTTGFEQTSYRFAKPLNKGNG
ncbi:MAG: GNAT family N-acetyltransferase [Sphingobium sp.]|uniref:GNAT family N-acetyltransferase n=1 Tax=Sphingobium sp. TaxID=1912891 RepID=UPI0029A7F465|nr:GNAT family N-acetyltransferase [Sphingobium sp.]MDX3909771.1 GNAT family N-acetyltransferase [Sphingobium sp.]